MRILFVSPHPDDIEFSMGSTEAALCEKGHEVFLLCFTGGEYGIEIDEFKGERLSKIRRRELRRASKIMGVKQVDFFGLIDGYVKLGRKYIDKLKEYMKKVNPDIVFCADPVFTVDPHNDHLKSGLMTYQAVKEMKKRPLLIYFYSFSPNYYQPCTHLKKTYAAFDEYVSQGFSNKLTKTFNKFFKVLSGLIMKRIGKIDAFRIIDFKKEPVKLSFWQKIWVRIFHDMGGSSLPSGKQYLPRPEDLGLKEFRF